MAQGVIRIMCTNLKCRTVLGVPENARGKMVRCKACGTAVRVPGMKAMVKPEEPARPDSGAESKPAA